MLVFFYRMVAEQRDYSTLALCLTMMARYVLIMLLLAVGQLGRDQVLRCAAM
jgi:hypothetical protein